MSEKRTLDNPQPFLIHPGFNDIKQLPDIGLYHSLSELKESFNDPDLKNKSIEYLAEYADYVTRGSLNQDWFKRDFISSLSRIMINPKYSYNMTTIGNIAYVCLNILDDKLKSNAYNILDIWRKFKLN